MEKSICPFGAVFLRARTSQNITQWHVAVSTGYHVTNLSKIEKGLYQPGVNLALRLVTAIGVDAGEFFQNLWEMAASKMPEALRGDHQGVRIDFAPFSTEGLRCAFGPLLLQARLHTGVTQRRIAEQAGYNLRNLGKVEKGEQEPGVMTALTMVMAAGCDVWCFFECLQELSGCHSKN